jgi:hypothetical protein
MQFKMMQLGFSRSAIFTPSGLLPAMSGLNPLAIMRDRSSIAWFLSSSTIRMRFLARLADKANPFRACGQENDKWLYILQLLVFKQLSAALQHREGAAGKCNLSCTTSAW